MRNKKNFMDMGLWESIKTHGLHVGEALLIADPAMAMNHDNRNDWTALQMAAWWGCDDIAKIILKHCPASVLEKDPHGHTALHIAAWRGHGDVARSILKAAPDIIDWANNDGETALHEASMHDKEKTVAVLLSKNANPCLGTAPTKDFPLGRLASELCGNEEIRALLIEAERNWNGPRPAAIPAPAPKPPGAP